MHLSLISEGTAVAFAATVCAPAQREKQDHRPIESIRVAHTGAALPSTGSALPQQKRAETSLPTFVAKTACCHRGRAPRKRKFRWPLSAVAHCSPMAPSGFRSTVRSHQIDAIAGPGLSAGDSAIGSSSRPLRDCVVRRRVASEEVRAWGPPGSLSCIALLQCHTRSLRQCSLRDGSSTMNACGAPRPYLYDLCTIH